MVTKTWAVVRYFYTPWHLPACLNDLSRIFTVVMGLFGGVRCLTVVRAET
jgi:hypothetical protein